MKVFVYGSLLSGLDNHRLLVGQRFIGEASTRPAFTLASLGEFPGMAAGGSQAVAGEVYQVTPECLAALDRLEGHPRFYRRSIITLDNGLKVATYLLPAARVSGCPIVESGSWREHRSSKNVRAEGW